MARHSSKSIPERKISETFLHFSAPMMRDLPADAPEYRARKALQVGFTIWNAVIFADVLNDCSYLDEIRRLTAASPETSLLIEELIGRKRALFPDDERLIGNWQLKRTEQGISLWADARDPHSLTRIQRLRSV